MKDLNALLNHKNLQLSIDDFNLLQQKMQLSEKLIINNYIFMAKVKSTEWIHSYKCINNITRNYHFIKIFDLTKLVSDQIPIEAQYIRSKTHKQMLMHPQYVVKCYELLQNENYIMVVLEYCNQGILQDKIMDRKTFPLRETIQWLKQIIYGLAQLYAQNIYLEKINLKKIFVHEDKCKVGDFQNLSRRLTMTEERLVKRHIYELSKLFARLVFGLKKVENDEITFILAQLKTTDMLFGVKLTNDVKEFLTLTLNSIEKQMISWEALISLKIFHDNSKSLSNTKFLSLSKLQPETVYKTRPKPIKTISFTQPTQQQQKLLRWDKGQYIEFLKTQLILNKIIHEIDDQQCYNLEIREVLEILYLLTVRCMYNIRDIMTKKDKIQEGSIFMKLFGEKVEEMEKQVSKRFYKYSRELTNKENEKLQIGKDYLNFAKSIFTFQHSGKERKNKFLTGIQSSEENIHDYSKLEQIQFTSECIQQFLSKFKVFSIQKSHVHFYLKIYKKISTIMFEDLESLTFDQYINELISKQVDQNDFK